MQKSTQNVNKITILNISGKKRDRKEFIDIINQYWQVKNYVKRVDYSAKQIIRKVQGWESCYDYIPDILLFENVNSNIVKIVGDELDNMVLDIRLNKFNKDVKNKEMKDCLELLSNL